MRNRIAPIAVCLALCSPVALPASAFGGPLPAQAAIARVCGSGYVSATIGAKHKCLRRGEFCSVGYRSQYVRYGFHCRRRGSYYRLS